MEQMQTGIHYVGHGGLASFAISAVDIALWDIRCKKAGLPYGRFLVDTTEKLKHTVEQLT